MSIIDEKLENFTKEVMSDVGDERRKIIEAADKELQREYADKEMTFLTDAYELIQESLIRIDQEKNQELSKTIMDNKIRLLKKRNEMIEEMVQEAKVKLHAYTKSEAYLPYLLSLIEEAKKDLGDGDLLITLDVDDAEIADVIHKKTGIEVELESKRIEMIGGCKVHNRTKNKIVDYSFARKLEDEKESFVFKCHLDIE